MKTALHIACNNGHTSVVKLLVENGANVEVKDRVSHLLHLLSIHN